MQRLADNGDWEAMAAALEPALELASDCTDAQLLLAQQSLNNSDYEGCTMATGRVLKIHSSHTEALLLRASAFFKLAVRSLMRFRTRCAVLSMSLSELSVYAPLGLQSTC